MKIVRFGVAFIVAAAATYVLASGFYTYRVLDEQAAIGAVYTPTQQVETYLANLIGLAGAYGLILTIGLLIAFPVAALLKRVLIPLAPIAYPLAGAAAVYTAIWLIENVVASGGVGALAGARSLSGVILQMTAGFIGGTIFAILRPRS